MASTSSGAATARVRPLAWAALVLALATAPAWAASADDGVAAPDDAATGAIRVYQHYLSDLRHARCRFTPSCSEYAAQSIARYGLLDGSARAADRLVRCDAAAVGEYPRRPDGTLSDPVGDDGPLAGVVRAPAWLRPAPEPDSPPFADTLDATRAARALEAATFAATLARRGQRADAALEYQRAGMLAGRIEADAWAFDRIGAEAARVSDALGAEGAFLTAAMLTPDTTQRARVMFRAALARFDGGSFSACERLLGDRMLIAVSATPGGVPDGARVAALGGLASLGLGNWDDARERFERAGGLAADTVTRVRIERLAAHVAEGPRLPNRSPGLAATMSAVIPGSGQMSCGRFSDGFRHLLFDGLLILTTISFARGDHVPAAVLTGSLALPFYLGNIRGAAATARRYDRERRMELLGRAVHDSAKEVP